MGRSNRPFLPNSPWGLRLRYAPCVPKRIRSIPAPEDYVIQAHEEYKMLLTSTLYSTKI